MTEIQKNSGKLLIIVLVAVVAILLGFLSLVSIPAPSKQMTKVIDYETLEKE